MKLFSNIAKTLINLIHIRKIILLESVPDLSDNTKAVFDELLRREINKDYKLVWLVEKDLSYPKINNVLYFKKNTTSKLNLLYYTYLLNCSKCIISCNRSIGSSRKGQTSFYLNHGTPVKTMKRYYQVSDNVDYNLVASENLRELHAYENGTKLSKIYAFGFPRNDDLISKKRNLQDLFGCCYEKFIVWYPTYRQSKNEDGIIFNTNALPIIHNEDSAKKINDIAKLNKTLIIMKPHFVQNVSYIKDLHLSNIIFIDDSFFYENNLSSYEFVGNCDALITDYSSVYYDFTLCDKPIAVTWDDIEEYRTNPGFAIDLDFYMKGAEKIYTADELSDFIERVAKGIDVLKKERDEIKKYVNYSLDSDNSKRVVDFIIEKANLY